MTCWKFDLGPVLPRVWMRIRAQQTQLVSGPEVDVTRLYQTSTPSGDMQTAIHVFQC